MDDPNYSDFEEPKIRNEHENPFIPSERYTGVDMRLNWSIDTSTYHETFD